MNQVWKLAIASLREHPRRLLLTSLATTASACLVIWVVSGYDALLKSHDEYSNLALGEYPLAIAPIDLTDPPNVPLEVVDALQSDPAVAAVDPMWLLKTKMAAWVEQTPLPDALPAGAQTRPAINSGYGSGPNAVTPDVILLATQSPAPPFPMKSGSWIGSDENLRQAVLRDDTASRFGFEVGDKLTLGEKAETPPVEIVGIVSAPVVRTAGGEALTPLRTPGSGEIFVSYATAEEATGQKSEISFLGISLAAETDINDFRFGWAPRLSQFSVPVQFQRAIDIEEALDESSTAANVRMQAFATTGIAFLVAALVILCTLSMGVSERIRQYAILRAIVMTRSQIALLVAIEGLILATVGFVGGVIIGQTMLWMTVNANAEGLRYAGVLGYNSLLLAACATYGGALLASILPAYRATRVRPVDAMSPTPQRTSQQRRTGQLLLIGLLLIALNPALTYWFPPGFGSGVYVSMTAGFMAMAFGFVCITPALVQLVDRCLSPSLAHLLRVDSRLLASQLSSRTWRTAGAAISMAIGMSLFVAVNVWGMTMLDAFIPGRWAPDAIVAFQPYGIPPTQAAQVASFPEVASDRCEPIVVEQPRLLNDLTGSAERASVTRQDNVVLVGIDVARAFGGANPLFKINWSEQQKAETLARFDSERACLVPGHFLVESNLKIGDSFTLVPPENPDQPVNYVIAGAIDLPGWHWQTKQTGFRSRTHRAAAIVFADYETVSADFSLPTASYVWFDYATPEADPQQISEQARQLYSRYLQRDVSTGHTEDDEPSVAVMPVERIREMTRNAARGWIWMLSQIPLISAGIACLGVLNMMLASVRARSWELGVIRAIGITRGTLIRAILAEGLLIGFVACILSLGFGVLAGWCGAGYAQYISFFGGLSPTLVTPWSQLAVGLVVFLAIVTVAMLWPALNIGRKSPHELMQQGRAGF